MAITEEQAVQSCEQMIRAAARVLMGAALDLLQKDPHDWSTRPCETCSTVTTIVGKPFGCELYARQRVKAGATL